MGHPQRQLTHIGQEQADVGHLGYFRLARLAARVGLAGAKCCQP
jgi:hypothetical protein